MKAWKEPLIEIEGVKFFLSHLGLHMSEWESTIKEIKTRIAVDRMMLEKSADHPNRANIVAHIAEDIAKQKSSMTLLKEAYEATFKQLAAIEGFDKPKAEAIKRIKTLQESLSCNMKEITKLEEAIRQAKGILS